MIILILGGADDDHAVHMHHHLSTLGHDVEFLDSRDFPARIQISYDPQANLGHITLPSGRTIPTESIHSVYWRCYNAIPPIDLPDPEQAHIAHNDARSLFESLLINLPCRWVNGWEGFQLHQTKGAALTRVANDGLRVPFTLLTNDAESVRAFADAHPCCIFKPVQGGAHTRRLTAAHLSDASLANLAYAPVTLQEEVAGTNIRVFVGGQQVLACEVSSREVDFRDDIAPHISAHELPQPLIKQSLRIAEILRLVWAGIDYRLSPEGDYYFLEANPSPMFLGFEQQTGLPLTQALAQVLTDE